MFVLDATPEAGGAEGLLPRLARLMVGVEGGGDLRLTFPVKGKTLGAPEARATLRPSFGVVFYPLSLKSRVSQLADGLGSFLDDLGPPTHLQGHRPVSRSCFGTVFAPAGPGGARTRVRQLLANGLARRADPGAPAGPDGNFSLREIIAFDWAPLTLWKEILENVGDGVCRSAFTWLLIPAPFLRHVLQQTPRGDPQQNARDSQSSLHRQIDPNAEGFLEALLGGIFLNAADPGFESLGVTPSIPPRLGDPPAPAGVEKLRGALARAGERGLTLFLLGKTLHLGRLDGPPPPPEKDPDDDPHWGALILSGRGPRHGTFRKAPGPPGTPPPSGAFPWDQDRLDLGDLGLDPQAPGGCSRCGLPLWEEAFAEARPGGGFTPPACRVCAFLAPAPPARWFRGCAPLTPAPPAEPPRAWARAPIGPSRAQAYSGDPDLEALVPLLQAGPAALVRAVSAALDFRQADTLFKLDVPKYIRGSTFITTPPVVAVRLPEGLGFLTPVVQDRHSKAPRAATLPGASPAHVCGRPGWVLPVASLVAVHPERVLVEEDPFDGALVGDRGETLRLSDFEDFASLESFVRGG